MNKCVGITLVCLCVMIILCVLAAVFNRENISPNVDSNEITSIVSDIETTTLDETTSSLITEELVTEESSTMKESLTSGIVVETEPPQQTQEEDFWEVSKLVYPVATEIWLQMKSYGWTDAACAGIMGNIMRESGGDILSWIDPDARCNGHYGLCQWSYKYYQDIHPHNGRAPSISEQIEYLRYTIINKDILHYNYGFDEEYLKTVTDYREAARVFHEEYEVSGASSIPRQNNAQDAWKWFVLRTEYNNSWLIQK